MRVAAWCLQNDFTKRPSMSMAIKVLEGVVDAKFDLDYCFLNPLLPNSVARVDNQGVHVNCCYSNIAFRSIKFMLTSH